MNNQFSDNVRNAIFGLLGLVLFVIGWILGGQTVTFSNAGPQHLISWQLDNYVHGLANTYSLTPDNISLFNAMCYGQGDNLNSELLAIQDRLASGEVSDIHRPSYETILSIVNEATCEQHRLQAGDGSEETSARGGNMLGRILGALLILGIIGLLAYFFLNRGSDADGTADNNDEIRPFPEPTPPVQAAPPINSAPAVETPPSFPEPAPPPPPTGPAVDDPTPLGGFQTTYVRGDDAFDKSFIIENGNGDFLGECGVSISESVGTEDGSRNVTAFEIWLFDKNDTHTVTKVVMSEHAHEDEATRAKLAPRGEPILASYDNTVALETNSLIINADVSEIVYSNMPPSNGVFDRFTVDLSAWVKSESEIRAASGDELDF